MGPCQRGVDDLPVVGAPLTEIVVHVDHGDAPFTRVPDQPDHGGQHLAGRGEEEVGVGVIVGVDHVDDDESGLSHD